MTIDELGQFAREHLGGHKRPKEYVRVDELPFTATGKLRRSALADQLFPERP